MATAAAAAQAQAMSSRERELCMLRLATAARRAGCASVALRIAQGVSTGAFPPGGDVISGAMHFAFDDSQSVPFARARVAAQAAAALATPGDARAGLAALQALDLGAACGSNGAMKAELLRLRGILCSQAGDSDAATASFHAAVQACAAHGGVWAAWGAFCEAQFKHGAGVGAPSADDWAAQAVTCYAAALRHGPPTAPNAAWSALWHTGREACKAHVLCAKILALLFSAASPAASIACARAFESSVSAPCATGTSPLAVWAFWLPQLLLAIERGDAPAIGDAIKPLLARLAVVCPHAAYYHLRAFVLDRREAVQRVMAATAQPAQEPGGAGQQVQLPVWMHPTAAAGDYARECRDGLRKRHPALVAELEVFLLELGRAFNPAPEERLLAVVHALLQRCYRQPWPLAGSVPSGISRELAGVCRACFSADTAAKHAVFVASFEPRFTADLSPASASFPTTLGGVVEALRRWREELSATTATEVPSTVRLEHESPPLASFRPQDMELPGTSDDNLLAATGWMQPWAPTVRLHRVAADVEVIRRAGIAHRVVTLLGADGSSKRFVVSSCSNLSAGGPGLSRTDERMFQLQRSLNAALVAHHSTRSRPGCTFAVPASVSVWPHVRLLEEDASCASLAAAYDASCARQGKDPDGPQLLFKARLDAATAAANADASEKATAAPGEGAPQAVDRGVAERMLDERLAAFAWVCSDIVSENVLSQFCYKTCATTHSLFAFRRLLATQLALSGLACYATRSGGRQPHRVVLSRANGAITQLECGPTLSVVAPLGFGGGDGDGGGGGGFVPLAVPAEEPVPFRLTRNLHTLFTPFGVEGVFVPLLAAAADAACASGGLDALCDLFWADVVALSWRGGTTWYLAAIAAAPSPSAQPGGGQTAAAISAPDAYLQALRRLSARCGSDMAARIAAVAPQGVQGRAAAAAAAAAVAAASSAVAAVEGNNGSAPPQLHSGAAALAEQAMSPAHLCRMPPEWQPWL